MKTAYRPIARSVVAALALVIFPNVAHAQVDVTVRPHLLFAIDTSGSMTCDINSRGVCLSPATQLHAPSANSCGVTFRSRVNDVRCVMTNVVNNVSDAIVGVARFRTTNCQNASCTGTNNNAFCTATDAMTLLYPLIDTTVTPPMTVPGYPISRSTIIAEQLQWFDFTAPGGACILAGACNNAGNPDINASGNTPLGGVLNGARTYFQTGLVATGGANDRVIDNINVPSAITGDPVAQCRPRGVILLTDGDETCGGAAPAQATALRTLVVGGQARPVLTYVIAMGTTVPYAPVEAIATAGGTTNTRGGTRGFYANSEPEIAIAINDIIASAQLREYCNGIDDNCNMLVDEGYNVGAVCTAGVGACARAGAYVCAPGPNSTATVCNAVAGAPGVENTPVLCNDGIDNDCDGRVDCADPDCAATPICAGGCVPTTEVCNGRDDNCDGMIDEGNPGGGTACGSNIGACRAGTTACVGGTIVCSGAVGASPEICDGIDNNCNGATDEGLTRACGVMVGECRAGIQQCVGGTFSGPCIGSLGPTPELCDGLDNDCDGTTDNGNPGGGVACGSNVGVCSNLTSCTGGRLVCTTVVGPTAEICDGLDNNCNGVTDEGITRACGSAVGACRPGLQACVAGSFTGPCMGAVGPTAEVCDGIDNNCDGTVDEGNPGGGAACGSSTGACRPGTTQCVMGALTCAGAVGPTAEVCDGVDNNCNGSTDEGLTRACGSSVGLCRPGIQACVGGMFSGPCIGSVAPTAEVCDGLDNNCDGTVDEGNPGGGTACGSSTGACRAGSTQCMMGTLSCVGAVGPTPETCDGIDNNCNGSTDEGLTRACGSSVGVCRPGIEACVGGMFSGPCIGSVGPSTEACDGLDNDCNGMVDEGDPGGGAACGVSGLGICTSGVVRCMGGRLVCTGGTMPIAEVCNGVDDDCNGTVDDGVTGTGTPCDGGVTFPTSPPTGICRRGATVCRAGMIVCEGVVGPGMEICNGLDDNCDGMIDEGLSGGACGSAVGECRAGISRCIMGRSVCEGAVGPTMEVCDNRDNDCDGETDEANPGGGARCGESRGECVQGVLVCRAGMLICDGGRGPGTEVCDGLDNDCNGMIDEGLTAGGPCGSAVGECREGTQRCVAGRIVCEGGVGPRPEECNCRDDDCDGTVDNIGMGGSPLCGGDAVCAGAPHCQCLRPCNDSEFPCPVGRMCADVGGRRLCVGDTCAGITCATTARCENGRCRELCEGVTCETGLVCNPRSGRCVENTCRILGCPTGLVCVDNACVRNPCDGVMCPADQACSNGRCVRSCAGVTCTTGQSCFEGMCRDDRCVSVTCPSGQICSPTTGMCVANRCQNINCAIDQRCDPDTGNCIADPCALVRCPTGQTCTNGTCNVPVDPPRARRDRVLPTGSGGFGCSVSQPGHDRSARGSALALFGLGVLVVVLRRRRGATRSQPTSVHATLAMAAALALTVSACRNEPYCLNCREDGRAPLLDASTPEVARVDVAPEIAPVDVQNDVPGDRDCDPTAMEACNGRDDNCDGRIDEGFDLQTDPRNCGTCGTMCNLPHAIPSCSMGRCVVGAGGCDTDFYDLDGDPANGCEYGCSRVPGATDDRTCDRRDDDCDGRVDEDVDLCTDARNCGMCGRACLLTHATTRCARTDMGTGACTTMNTRCEVATCETNFHDLDGDPTNGCEYECTAAGAETCNGRDDNCDGVIDEGDPGSGGACGSTTGACRAGVQHCRMGSLVCEGDVRPTAETCNGIDDDCNGMVDDGSLTADMRVGGACGSGVGDCRPGSSRCVAGLIECVGDVRPTTETCDGRDNNCDGMIDEGIASGGSCGSSTGACRPGSLSCIGGRMTCTGGTAPGVETCNGIDDDCNGSIDDGSLSADSRIGSSCGSGVGECRVGVNTCRMGAPTCTGAGGPRAEVCDGLDNDCDGANDNGVPTGGACGNSVGACRPGLLTCVGGTMSCVGGTNPTAETCNGIDDDCNGATDDGALSADPRIGVTCGSSTGECRQGTQRCVSGAPVCQGETGPTAESCDGRDNDCNAMIDDGIASGGSCGSSVGACLPGALTCVGGTMTCVGGTNPAAETCNGIDDDCNGAADDGTLAADPRIGVTCGSSTGECRPGTQRCVAGAPTCQGGTGPSAEVCDSRDNDCNGTIDDGIASAGPCGSSVGTCRPGALQCVAGGMRCVGSIGPLVELCNGLDDDCNGVVDNGFDLTRDVNNCGACGTVCVTSPHAFVGCTTGSCGILACEAGFVDLDRNPANGCEYACVFQSATEICNGLDDNCNGAVDEALTPPAGFCRSGGACGTPGPTPACAGAAGWRCTYPPGVDVDAMTGQPAATETRCDGVDNNCNGAIDEVFVNLGQSCRVGPPGTACENFGTFVCRADQLATTCSVSAPLPPGAETCNGRDDDCDGSTDETSAAPGASPSFVPMAWSRVQPTRTCGIIPGSGAVQARCTGSANCDGANTLQCLAGFWCDATVATPPGASVPRSASCNPYYWVTQYEVSAPNATAAIRGDVLFSSAPRVVNRACSAQGVVPWTNVTPVDATSACTRIGATLCTEGQWQASCEVRTTAALTNCVFGFETACTVYAPVTCNGLDFDFIPGGTDDDGLLVTGSARIPQCDANWTGVGLTRVFDLTGNAREITAVRVGLVNAYPLRGGSYTSPQGAMRCDSSWTLVDGAFFYPNTGFRCCSTAAVPP